MSIPLIAKEIVVYDGKSYAPGDSFDALTESDAKVLTLIGKARAATVAPILSRAADALRTRAIAVESDDTADPEPEKPKRTNYRRRDLTAEVTEK